MPSAKEHLTHPGTVPANSAPNVTRSGSQRQLSRRLGRGAALIGKVLIALIVLPLVCVLWLLLFLLFLPLLLASELLGWRRKLAAANRAGTEISQSSKPAVSMNPLEAESTDRFVFDRRRDVSKLFGCNTRNVQYRWSIFTRYLAQLQKQFANPTALDFGAGSLRDSFELSHLGFRVVSVDLDEKLINRYHGSYAWSETSVPAETFTGSLEELAQVKGPGCFHLTIAFDVVEHLEDAAGYLKKIGHLLDERGLLFTIVPNRKSIFERYFRYSIGRQRAKGLPWTPGVPHLQFKSPTEWERFFESNGFRIVAHDMAIGFFVNDWWNGLLGLPLRVLVCPAIGTLAYFTGMNFNATRFEESFCPPWLMERVHVIDELFRKQTSGRFGWNLIVAQKSFPAGSLTAANGGN